jgi:hypothetical protein
MFQRLTTAANGLFENTAEVFKYELSSVPPSIVRVPIFSALSTLTSGSATTPVSIFRREASEVKGFLSQRYSRIARVSFLSRSFLARVASLCWSLVKRKSVEFQF